MPHPDETRGLLNDAVQAAILAALGPALSGLLDQLAWGQYTPTITNQANITAAVAGDPWTYVRIGSVCIVAGRVDIQPTAGGGTQTEIRVSTPIGSTFDNAGDAGGVFAALAGATEVFAVAALNAGPFTIRIAGVAQTAANKNFFGIFMYRIS